MGWLGFIPRIAIHNFRLAYDKKKDIYCYQHMTKIKIQEITASGCSHCAAAKKILEEKIKPQFPAVEVEYIDMTTERGQKMIQDYGIMSSPGIIVNGELFSVGGLDLNKLIKKIKSLS